MQQQGSGHVLSVRAGESVASPEPWDGPVSDFSHYADDVWRFENDTAGLPESALNWRLAKPEGGGLDDAEWSALLDMGKRLLWSIKEFNARGSNVRGAKLAATYVPLIYLMRWMAAQDLWTFAHLTPEATAKYVAHLERAMGKESKSSSLAGTVAKYVDVPCRIYEQRSWVFKGCEAMAEHPLAGRTAGEEARGIASSEMGWIPPVPDEVWLPVVRTALAWLGEPARHVAHLGKILAALGEDRGEITPDGDDIIDAVGMADREGTLLDWLVAEARIDRPDAPLDVCLRNRSLWRLHRSLLLDVRDACTIVVQAMLGMRVSEVAGLVADPVDPANGWPACIGTRRSKTGLNEIFYVRGWVYKGRLRPGKTEWVAGSRPFGTDHIPTAIRALLVLDEAFRPWRSRGTSRRLILSVNFGPVGRIEPLSVRSILSAEIGDGQKRFLRRRVTLPNALRDYRLSTHQWRKSFAIHMVRVDERLLGAVSDHFKHMNIAMTEQGYVGRDAGMLDLINDTALRTTARMLREAAEGRTALAGIMANAAKDGTVEILAAFGKEGTDEDKDDRVAGMMRTNGIRVSYSPWGNCLFRPETARCHHDAQGAFDLSARQPDYGFRHPSICCDCANLLISPIHGDFWRRRHAENEEILRECEAGGDQRLTAVAKERVRTSASVLRKLDKAVKPRPQSMEVEDAG